MKNRKVHLSFLGTTNYLPCNYYYKYENNRVEGVRYVQEASFHLLCSDFDEKDSVYVFATEGAMAKNWEDNGHAYQGKTILSQGLKTRFASLNLACPVTPVPIKNGTTEQEIWEIFQTIFDLLASNDEIVLDITYGFRSFPMLAMVLINYAKTLKKITVRSICYGGIEVLTLGGKRLGEIPEVERNAPILELSSFSILQDWSNAAQDFLAHGNSKKIEELTSSKEIEKLLEEGDEKEAVEERFYKFNESIKETTLNIATVRGLPVIEGKAFQNLNEAVDEIEITSLIAPLKPLLEKIKKKIHRFEEKDVKNMLKAAEWCADHDLIQQGITFLQVFIVIYALDHSGYDYEDKCLQDIASSCLILKKIAWFKPNHREKEVSEQDQIKMARAIFSKRVVRDFKPIYKTITQQTRNDINHGGMRNNFKSPFELKKVLVDCIARTNKIIG